MPENLFETQYDLTKKTKLREFYESKKIIIYSSVLSLIIVIASYTYYLESGEKEKIYLSENYMQAKVYLERGNKTKAVEILRDVIFSNDPTYSTLSFFMILNENLISSKQEVSKLFDHLLENNKFDKEIRDLLLYKKILYKSNYVEEPKMLEEIKPLLNNKESVWRGHALLLLGDFYFSKEEYIKAKDFYSEILSTENLQQDLYSQAKSKLVFIADD